MMNKCYQMRPTGPLVPASQFLTVLSLAPVHRIAVFIIRCVSPRSEPIKRGDRGRSRTMRRIERGGGDGGEPVRSPLGRLTYSWPHGCSIWGDHEDDWGVIGRNPASVWHAPFSRRGHAGLTEASAKEKKRPAARATAASTEAAGRAVW